MKEYRIRYESRDLFWARDKAAHEPSDAWVRENRFIAYKGTDYPYHPTAKPTLIERLDNKKKKGKRNTNAKKAAPIEWPVDVMTGAIKNALKVCERTKTGKTGVKRDLERS